MRSILILSAVITLFSTGAYSKQDFSNLTQREEFNLAIGCTVQYDLLKPAVQSDETLRPIIDEFSEYSRLAAMALALVSNPDKGGSIYKFYYRANRTVIESADPKLNEGARKRCHDYMSRARLIAETFCKNPNFSDLENCSYFH